MEDHCYPLATEEVRAANAIIPECQCGEESTEHIQKL